MKLKTKLILSYISIALFLVAALIWAFLECDTLCYLLPYPHMYGRMLVFLGFALLALVIALGASLLFATQLSRPLKLVTASTQAIANGSYREQIDLKTNTLELDALIVSVNHLARTLEEEKQRKRRMAQDYSHEFRTPLAAIQSNLEGILDEVFEPTPQRIESIRQEIIRLSHMVSDIHNIVELENKTQQLRLQSFDFSDLLRRTLLTFENELKIKQLQVQLQAPPCPIVADPDKIGSVLVNLLSNAAKYTAPQGTIRLTVLPQGEHLVFTVADNGCGIRQEDLPHIFEHLYRADTSRTRQTGGSGIGLAVVQAILLAHGGQIQAASQLGQGTEFTVTLPLAPQL